jgi:CRISPR-associated protein Cas6
VHINLDFPVQGDTLPIDHHYLLYSSLSHAVGALHSANSLLRFAAIGGERAEKGLIRPHPRSRLRLRLPADQIGTVLPLAGRTLQIGDHSIHLGIPTVAPLRAAPLLAAKVVTYKHALDPIRFLDVTRRRLDEMGVSGEPGIPLIQTGPRAGEPRRQVLTIKGKRIIGYALQVAGLTAEESVRLQELGLGGRRRMGCGFFVPYQARVL